MRLLLCGGRHYNDSTLVYATLDDIHRQTPVTLLIHEAEPGVSSIGELWARARGIEYHGIPAIEVGEPPAKDERARRVKMFATDPQMVVRFPAGGEPSRQYVDEAGRRGLPVREVEPDEPREGRSR